MKDPYRISEIYRLLDKDRDLKGISNEIREYLAESEAWIYVEKREVAISNHSAYSAADIIGMWRKGMLTSSDDDKIRKVTSRLYWPIQIIKASRLEERGQLNAAWHSYGQALKAMPSWIPDAKTLLDKINNLRTYKDQ